MDANAIIAAVCKVTDRWAKRVQADERDQKAAWRREEQESRRESREQESRERASERATTVSLKAAVFAVMETGIHQASGAGRARYPKRNLYYSVRKLIQDHTDAELKYSYFESVLQEWEGVHGEAPGKYCDPRGYFVEPHTRTVIPLGTREVEEYSIPAWWYDKILYVEKKGFHELFKIGQIAEKYDIGIICAEGYAVDAAKLLLARAESESRRMTIFCLHDADPFGYNIVRKLRDASRLNRSTSSNIIQVIDMGLSLEDALALGLDTEEFVRDRALPQGIKLNKVEREYFEGRPAGHSKGRQLFRCRRVELNALAADPDRFIEYVEQKLKEYRCAKKLVPPKNFVQLCAMMEWTAILKKNAQSLLMTTLDIEGIATHVAASFAKNVQVLDGVKTAIRDLRKWAKKCEPQSWRLHLDQDLRKAIGQLDGELREAVLVKTRDVLANL